MQRQHAEVLCTGWGSVKTRVWQVLAGITQQSERRNYRYTRVGDFVECSCGALVCVSLVRDAHARCALPSAPLRSSTRAASRHGGAHLCVHPERRLGGRGAWPRRCCCAAPAGSRAQRLPPVRSACTSRQVRRPTGVSRISKAARSFRGNDVTGGWLLVDAGCWSPTTGQCAAPASAVQLDGMGGGAAAAGRSRARLCGAALGTFRGGGHDAHAPEGSCGAR